MDKLGSKQTISATREIILSAGAVQTPHLLMLSGVGPAALLQSAGIETIVDSPGVGDNLQDHIAMGGTAFLFDAPRVDPDERMGFVLPRVSILFNFEIGISGQVPLRTNSSLLRGLNQADR